MNERYTDTTSTTSDTPASAECLYFDDSKQCQYCSASQYDQIEWKAAHRVVPYWLYHTAIITCLLLGLWVGVWIGAKL